MMLVVKKYLFESELKSMCSEEDLCMGYELSKYLEEKVKDLFGINCSSVYSSNGKCIGVIAYDYYTAAEIMETLLKVLNEYLPKGNFLDLDVQHVTLKRRFIGTLVQIMESPSNDVVH